MTDWQEDSEGARTDFLTYAAKIAATGLLCTLVWKLWSAPAGQAALNSYVRAIGAVGLATLVAAFLVVVVLYCRTLQRCLSLVGASHRVADPRSVWLMFLIPYNFIEDFFIVNQVASSLRREASENTRLRGFSEFGTWWGNGWCAAQLLSLIPGSFGEAAGLSAIVLWARHWHLIARVNRLLARPRKLPNAASSQD
jgi:hypothetical protein